MQVSPNTATTQNPPPSSPHGLNCHFSGVIRTNRHNAPSLGNILAAPVSISAWSSSGEIGVHMALMHNRRLELFYNRPPHVKPRAEPCKESPRKFRHILSRSQALCLVSTF